MRVVKCDRCRKYINKKNITDMPMIIYTRDATSLSFDLCEECISDFVKFLDIEDEDSLPSIEDFKKYVKENFGIDLKTKKSDNPDTVTKILYGRDLYVNKQNLKKSMIEYGWTHPDSTVSEFVDSLPNDYVKGDYDKGEAEWYENENGEIACDNCGVGWKGSILTIPKVFHFCPNCGYHMH